MFMKTQGRATECRSIKRFFPIEFEGYRGQCGEFSSLAKTSIAKDGGTTNQVCATDAGQRKEFFFIRSKPECV
jgi:hypothetical protein